MPAEDDDVEVVHSTYALEVVSGWLGVTAEEAFQEAGPTPVDTMQPRQQYLGLGAKATPPPKGWQAPAMVGKRLKGRIERSRKLRADGDEEQPAEGAASWRPSKPGFGASGRQPSRGAGGKRPAPDQQDGGADAAASGSGNESEGRATAVAAGGGKRQAASAAVLRSQLLAPIDGSPQQQAHRRKKKRKGAASAAAGQHVPS